MLSLITNIDDFKLHVGLNASMETDSFRQLQPDLLLAEDEQLRSLLGPFYDEFLEALDGELSAEQERLRYLLQSALANLTMVGFLDIGQVQISGSGVQIISTEREKTAFQWQINNLKASFGRKGLNGLEKVLAYLESKPVAFPTWAASDAAARARAHFLDSAAQFSEHYNISNARLTFLALLPLLKKTETFALEPVLGEDFLDELQAQQAAGTLTPENAALVEKYLRPALAHLVIAQAIGELGFGLNGAALELNVYRPDDSNSKESDPGLQKLLDMKVEQALEDGERFLRRLRTKLNAEASEEKYATYFNSSAYEVPTAMPYITTEKSAPIFLGF